jgi:hypothetical protein
MTNIFVPTAVSADIAPDANHLAMVLGSGPDDARTWETPLHQDAAGNLYIVRHLWVSPAWVEGVSGALQRPLWDVDGVIDMDAASRAQVALVLHVIDPEQPDAPLPLAQPGKITSIIGLAGAAAVEGMGLSLAPQEDEA